MSRLNDFLCELLQAVGAYKEERFDDVPDWFMADRGICDNWYEYTKRRDISREAWQLGQEGLEEKFQRSGLHHCYPFNGGESSWAFDNYVTEHDEATIFDNAARMTWLCDEVIRIKAKGKAA